MKRPLSVSTPGRVVACLSAAMVLASPQPPVSSQTPPNVVVILIDDLGFRDIGVNGSTFYDTPNIDRLARSGARFTAFYTASPVCSPTRASLMTGRHPARLHITDWIGGNGTGLLRPPRNVEALPDAEVTLGELFRERGYATGYIGKWHLGASGHLPDRQGFAFMRAVNGAGQPGSHLAPYRRASFPESNVPDLAEDGPGTYLADRLTDIALDFLEANQRNPFLLVLAHYAVHTPLEAPEARVARYREKAAGLPPERPEDYTTEHGASVKRRQDHPVYAAMVESTDTSVGRVLARLDDLGIADRTIVVFVSDNGGLSTLIRRSPNQATSNAPLRAGKGWLYEGGVRAPLLVRWPGRIPAGLTITAPAMSTDLVPTLLELTGAPLRPDLHLDGVSLADQMTGGAPAPPRSLFWHFPHYHGSGMRPAGAVRDGDLKLIEWFENGQLELYDLAADEGEARDLASDRPQDVRRLHDELLQWRMRVGAEMPVRAGEK